ncbi:sphingosine-1-phosphate lyase [Thrips palmi]|uniref:sphinganine-1-phosphate aldolase n=1 Tax=Thrips palmi TaxID=161013 RepID=A0A6P8YPW8_THRPL|nr:sphingosine-1-phosphate lyase [Thrips palmi]XP_034239300.1 sphingosine-1-phosphate lyase [Thrips palmi]XP_034239301.1 sphingosine-1-phosphate lyase [Thrips palmi]XP_034239302.1 sphingosine-1-phosphate lyase [Thrips palmi]XP_034239303.1 sphingosine-1-phosphate lyase [Thrips palmi]
MALCLVKSAATNSKEFVNGLVRHKEPWQIVAITATGTLVGVWMFEFIFDGDESAWARIKKSAFRLLRKIPAVRNKIDSELQKIQVSFSEDAKKRYQGKEFFYALPSKGQADSEIMKQVHEYLELGEYQWKDGYLSGSLYMWNQKLIELLTEVCSAAFYTNPLHPDVFPGVNKMEAEVVRISCNLFRGGPDSCGTMTTGGTESIFMACKAYRDYARETKGTRRPEIIVPVTAHAAFDKAAHYLGIRIKHIPVNEDTTVNIAAMKRAISKNTCMLVGSAPNFPYGTIDDIKSIGELGLKYNIPVHVDACLGGFIAAFMDYTEYQMPPFDFRVPGVTSISADTHKYGFAPKGSSVVLYSEQKYRRFQYTVTTDWPGGVYGSPTVGGSRCGAIIATCWATFMHFGMEGYVEATRQIVKATKHIENGLRKIDGIFVFGRPVTSVVAVGSKDFDIYRLQEAMQSKGWNLNTLQFPKGIHLCVTHLHTEEGRADAFLKDVREAVAVIMKNPQKEVEGSMAMYGASTTLQDRSIVTDFTRFWIDALYYTPDSA